ncbi:MAG TPA: hypothetical protein VHT28_17300 [Silvibacterium sp.]|nr:hypothetical protein [Silvibacterium sp.]
MAAAVSFVRSAHFTNFHFVAFEAYDADVERSSIHFVMAVLIAGIAPGQQQVGHDIIARLLPDGNPHRIVSLDTAEKNTAVKQLRAAQKAATDEQSVEVAFLLAAYDSDYEKNRDYLIENLRGCTTPALKSGCDRSIAHYLIVLYERGHKDVLKPLMLLGKDSYNPIVSEGLGDFFSDLLADSPGAFLDTIRQFEPQAQKQLCDLAGAADGDGLSADKFQRVQKELKARNDELSLTCLQVIEAANRPE